MDCRREGNEQVPKLLGKKEQSRAESPLTERRTLSWEDLLAIAGKDLTDCGGCQERKEIGAKKRPERPGGPLLHPSSAVCICDRTAELSVSDASNPALSSRISQSLKTAKIASMESGGSLDLDTDETSGRIFQNNIDLLPRGSTPVIKLRLRYTPARLFP